jgi:hypothetical protein
VICIYIIKLGEDVTGVGKNVAGVSEDVSGVDQDTLSVSLYGINLTLDNIYPGFDIDKIILYSPPAKPCRVSCGG